MVDSERPSRDGASRGSGLVLAGAAALMLLVAIVAWWLLQSNSPTSPADTGATAEARQFATAEVYRQATRDAAAAMQTAQAAVTATEQAEEQARLASGTAEAATRYAQATAQAPPTLTAEAIQFEADRAEASATAAASDAQATRVYGPLDGTLSGDCIGTGTTLPHFIAEVTLRNPSAAVWDYGLVFTNEGQDSQYRMVLDSSNQWTLNLHAPGYDISNRDTTQALDTSPGAANTLKLYVLDDTALLYINGHYIDTLDLTMFMHGSPPGTKHHISLCTSILATPTASPPSTTYTNFTLWSLP